MRQLEARRWGQDVYRLAIELSWDVELVGRLGPCSQNISLLSPLGHQEIPQVNVQP